MLGDIKGYAFIISTEDILIGYNKNIDPNGYAEIQKDIIGPNRIIDIAVDGNGLLCLENKGRCIFQVNDMKSVKWWFKCEEVNGILLPPCGDNFRKRINELAIRMAKFNGGIPYDKLTKAAVITNSFLKGEFDDSFLFKD